MTSDLRRRWAVAATAAWQATEALGGLRINRCVLQTRLLLEVSRRRFDLGHKVQAVNTGVMAANEAWFEQIASGKANVATPIADFPEGAWSVGVDPRILAKDGSSFPGHLVLIVDDTLLVDGSAPQFSRPDHQMPIPSPLVITLPDEWRDGYPAVARNGRGAVITYFKAPTTSRGWQAAPDWRPPPGWLLRPTLELTDQLMKEIDGD